MTISLDSWKTLWQYAHKYTEDYFSSVDGVPFASVGSKCPLCHQVILEDSVAARMQGIDSYVNGKAVESEKKNFGIYETSIKSFPQPKSESDFSVLVQSSGIGSIANEITELHKKLIDFWTTLCNSNDIEIESIDIPSFIGLLDDELKGKRTKITELDSLMNNDAQQVLEQQVLELEAEEYFVSIHDIIKKNIENLRNISLLDSAIKQTATNKITTKSKELAEELITADYVKRFERELNFLTKNSIAVKLSQQKAGHGRIPYKVVLCDVDGKEISPKDILSEGENRVTSLAAFFAEASGRNEVTPLIVDDPISSLDYAYEGKVIERLIQAAKHRQVIVFTHRISMVVGIYEKAKEAELEYKEIELLSSKTKKGVPSDNSSIGGKVRTQLNVLINDKLSKLRNQKATDEFSDEYKILFHNICQEFRNVVEKSVEDILINEVVKRFRRDIQTKNRLNKLAEISEDDCKLIDSLMTKYSYYDHSMSDETPLQEITFEELECDLNALKEWISQKAKT